MLDVDYNYLASRLGIEKNCVRNAKCPEAATAHQNLANAYIAQLPSLTQVPPNDRWVASSGREQLGDSSKKRGFSTHLGLRSANAHRRSPA